jgi:hypothetical protein
MGPHMASTRMRSCGSTGGAQMKARTFQLFTVMALFALWLEPIFDGVKW